MFTRAALLTLLVLGAGCATTPLPAAPDAVLPFADGDHASYRLAGTDVTMGVRLSQDESGLQRWDRRAGEGPGADLTSTWIHGDGSIAMTRDRARTTWFDPGCALGWPHVTTSKCLGRSEAQHDDGTTQMWGPLEATQQSSETIENVAWAGRMVPARQWSLASEVLRMGEPPAQAFTQLWFAQPACFPVKIVESFDEDPLEWLLVHSACQGVVHGDPAAAVVWGPNDAHPIPSPERQPIASCAGAIASNATETISGRHFDCPLFEAFNIFWLVPGQGLQVTADWGGGPTAGMALEVDGQIREASTPPIVLQTTAFSVSPDEVVVRLTESGVPNAPPRLDRPVTITLEGFATD